MPVMVTLAIAIIHVLAVIATRMTRRVKDQDARVEVARAQARDSILILITSYLDEQVDRSECIFGFACCLMAVAAIGKMS